MASKSKDDKGIYISEEEMGDLGEFLQTIQQYLLSHEARIGAIEGVLAEMFESPKEDSEGGVVTVDELADHSS